MAKLTKRFIETEIQAPKSGQTIYRDDELPGFAVRVTAKSQSYIVERRVNGINCRWTLGKHTDLTPEAARNLARIKLGEMAKGQDPRAHIRTNVDGITLEEVLEKYLAVKQLRQPTRIKYRYHIRVCLADWLDKPIRSITKDMVEIRHQELSVAPTRLGTSGHARADGTMKSLKALINFASDRYGTEDEPFIRVNPVIRLSRNKAWHRVQPRQGIIADHKLADWYRAIATEKHAVTRDYLLFLLLTGMRRGESLQLRWSHVDIEEKLIVVPRELTKNDREHQLPLSDFLVQLLKDRLAKRVASDWVFQSATDKSKHISQLGFALPRIRRKCGFMFQLHDLRRTFLSMGEKLDVPHYALKRLVNHHDGRDVTDRYIILDPERLRVHMSRITAAFVQLLGADVHDLGEWKRVENADLTDGRQLLLPLTDVTAK